MSAIPLQRSKALLQEQGWSVWIVEVWNAWAHRRQDCFGFADLMAIRSDVNGVWAIQCCGDSEVQEHLRKYNEGWVDAQGKKYDPNPYISIWKSAGNKFSIFAWGKRGERGKRKIWTLREIQL